MKTIDLTSHTSDWRTIIAAIETSGDPVTLTVDGTTCGILLPTQAAQRLAERYTPATPHAEPSTPKPFTQQNYLELLRDNPTLVPIVDGQPLEFVTMMNSSYIDPRQLYQFKHPQTHQMHIYRASELEQAIGQTFASVDFIPQRPKDFVEGKG